jgi:hypothetical protein
MTRLVVDTQTWAKLSGTHELLELCDGSGHVLGYYGPVMRVGTVENGKIQSPFSDEEIEERRRQTGGQTLADFVQARSQS